MGTPMTEDQARAECARLAREHPERETSQFLPREVEGGWAVVKVGLTPPLDNLNPEVKAASRPETADDPRSAQMQNIPPYGAG